jgi:hypothetical protein
MLKSLLVIASLMLLPPPVSAEIYKCRLPNGKTEITNIPCAIGSETLTTRPDERVSEAARKQAEREVERMRQYVEKREAVQRADETAARDERVATQRQRSVPSPAARPPRQYSSPDECLREIEPMALEANQRTQMEAECQNIVTPQNIYVPGAVPAYPLDPNMRLPPAPKPEPQPAAPTISFPPRQQ